MQMEGWVRMGGNDFSVEYECNIVSQRAFTKERLWLLNVVPMLALI